VARPANTSLTAAVTLARQMNQNQIVVVQETEYTGAGKHHNSQLSFARENGIEVRRGDPQDNIPGKAIVIPERLDQVWGKVQDLERLRLSYLKNAARAHPVGLWNENDIAFLSADLKVNTDWVRQKMADMLGSQGVES